MQHTVALSVTEAELIQCVECAQDMLYVMHVLEDMGLKVNKPMILECDNQDAVNIANNWSSTGRTRHMDVRYKFLRELKEEGEDGVGVLHVLWIPGESNEADMFTKNVSGPSFNKDASFFVGNDEYM
jgi:hypothetical protein